MGSRESRGGEGKKYYYRNPCLTMHQPWASLLIHGIKRVEGRSWPSPITGRLWIHAAGKLPEPATIKAMEDFYREIYALNGINDLKFPEHYPVSRLLETQKVSGILELNMLKQINLRVAFEGRWKLGCVEVVGCVKQEELVSWEELPEGVRLEGQTDYCWLCEQPQKLVVPFEMRGYQGVYNLEKKIFEAAVRGLLPVKPPFPIKFPLPDPQDPLSLKPGSLESNPNNSRQAAELAKPPSLSKAIAGAKDAATQFSKKNNAEYFTQDVDTAVSTRTRGKSKEQVHDSEGS